MIKHNRKNKNVRQLHVLLPSRSEFSSGQSSMEGESYVHFVKNNLKSYSIFFELLHYNSASGSES